MSDSAGISRALVLGPGFSLPEDAVTQTMGILAVKRAGKSNAAVVMAESMYRAGIPWVAVDPKGDWWGVRSSGNGKGPGLAVPVFGGEHADVPLEPTGGNLVADLIAEQRLTCVLDVSEMSKGDQRKFLTAFAQRLYKRNREPLHVFCEEADEYIPQRVTADSTHLVNAFETLVKRGGFRGIGVTLITQRSASLNKDVLTQVGTLFALRTTSPQDRKAIAGWVEFHAESSDALATLSSLPNGEAWMFSPEWIGTLERVKFRRRETFDSGATPTVGQVRREPTSLADVDLAAIKELMADTVERAKDNDPAELRKKVKQLERELNEAGIAAAKAALAPVEPTIVEVPTPFVPPAVMEAATALSEATEVLLSALRGVPTDAPVVPAKSRMVRSAAVQAAPRRPVAQRSSPQADVDVSLGKGERKVLSVLAQYPEGRSHNQLAFLAGYSAKASTLGVILAKLRKVGLVEGDSPPRLTPEGMELADPEPLPTGADLLNHWLTHERMGEGERRVLGALVDNYPTDLTHGELCEITGYSSGASTMGVILSKLRKLGLVAKGARRLDPDFAEAIT